MTIPQRLERIWSKWPESRPNQQPRDWANFTESEQRALAFDALVEGCVKGPDVEWLTCSWNGVNYESRIEVLGRFSQIFGHGPTKLAALLSAVERMLGLETQ